MYGGAHLYEEGAAEGEPVTSITGNDVAGFVDELMKEVDTYMGRWGSDLNEEVARKVNRD